MEWKQFFDKNKKIILIIFTSILMVAAYFIYDYYKNNQLSTNPSYSDQPNINVKIIKKGVVKDYLMKNNQPINLNPFDIKGNKPLKKEIFKYLTTPYFNFDYQNNQKITEGLCKLEVIGKGKNSQIYNINADNLDSFASPEFTFTLNKDIKFINNELITIEHILFSLKQLQKNGNLKDLMIEDKSCDNENKFKISFKNNKDKKLKEIINLLNENLILVPITEYNNSLSDNQTTSSYGTKVNYFISYGLYKIDDFVDNQIYKFSKINGSNDKLEIYICENQTDLEQLFDIEKLTELSLDTPHTIGKLKKYQNNDYQIHYINELGNTNDVLRMTALYLNFGENDQQKNISKNINFRKALFFAINRDKLLNDLSKCNDNKTSVYEKKTISFLPDKLFLPGNPNVIMNDTPTHKDNVKDYEYNLDKAKSFFEQVLTFSGLSKIQLNIISPEQSNVNDYKQIAKLLKEQLEEAFGNEKISITLGSQDPIMNQPNQKQSQKYNNIILIDDLKYSIQNLPFFTSLNKKDKCNEKIIETIKKINQSEIESKVFDELTLEQLEKEISNLKQKYNYKQELLTIFNELEKYCYQELLNIPLLIKPQKILITKT
ncbi:MAG: ABC transporter substrate-binding protein [Candidatus Phytoplasma vitis]|nr:MAG: ABC transporter substrate-binding protein [Candidatus Phytoplasma vitis]